MEPRSGSAQSIDLRRGAAEQRRAVVGAGIRGHKSTILPHLSQDLAETASFYVRQDDKRLVLYRVEPARSVRVGEEFPIDKGASGKVLRAFTEHQPKLAEVREQLWAVSRGERDPETASVSAPVFGSSGELVGALTMSGPKGRFDLPPILAEAVRALLAGAKRATVALGGDGGRFEASLAAAGAAGFRVG